MLLYCFEICILGLLFNLLQKHDVKNRLVIYYQLSSSFSSVIRQRIFMFFYDVLPKGVNMCNTGLISNYSSSHFTKVPFEHD